MRIILIASLMLLGCPSPPPPTPPPAPKTKAAAATLWSPPTISSADLINGCLANPPPVVPGNPEAYAQAPWDSCLLEIRSIRPLPVFDEQPTRIAREKNPQACCYQRLGNR